MHVCTVYVGGAGLGGLGSWCSSGHRCLTRTRRHMTSCSTGWTTYGDPTFRHTYMLHCPSLSCSAFLPPSLSPSPSASLPLSLSLSLLFPLLLLLLLLHVLSARGPRGMRGALVCTCAIRPVFLRRLHGKICCRQPAPCGLICGDPYAPVIILTGMVVPVKHFTRYCCRVSRSSRAIDWGLGTSRCAPSPPPMPPPVPMPVPMPVLPSTRPTRKHFLS